MGDGGGKGAQRRPLRRLRRSYTAWTDACQACKNADKLNTAVGGSMRTINIFNPLSLLSLTFVCNFASVCAAQPVEYTRVCTLAGQGYFYVPGTDMCLNPMTGKTFQNTQYGPVTGESPVAMNIDRALEDAHRSLEGVAISVALPTAIIAPGKTYAIAADFGTFDAYNAAGFGAALKLNDNFQLNAAVGVGLSGHTGAARVGANFSW